MICWGIFLDSAAARFLDELKAIVWEEYVYYHPEGLLVYGYDGSIDRGLPGAVVLPISTDEVRRVVALCCGRVFPWWGGVPGQV